MILSVIVKSINKAIMDYFDKLQVRPYNQLIANFLFMGLIRTISWKNY